MMRHRSSASGGERGGRNHHGHFQSHAFPLVASLVRLDLLDLAFAGHDTK
jgi:hypothetical protein